MNILLIPSATLIPLEMRSQMGAIPVCLFPLQNVTMLERICDWYRDVVERVYVVVGEGKEKVYDYIKLKHLSVHVVELDEIRDLGYTIWRGMDAICSDSREDGQVYINFGDTLLSNKPNTSRIDAVYYVQETYSKQWTFFESEAGTIMKVVDKGSTVVDGKRSGNAFPGVFEIAHLRQWANELRNALDKPEEGIDSFYRALMRYSAVHPFTFLPAEDWFDVGHQERYVQARSIVAARSFNTIEIDKDRGLLTKRSENKEKLIDEINWYLKLPNQLQYLIPRIYNYSLNWNDPYVTMEYYGYTTLHEMLVYGDIDETQWRKIFYKLQFILNDMHRFLVKDPAEDITQALEEVYLNKTVSRLEKLRNDSHFLTFFKNKITVNGKEYPSLDECICILPELIHTILLANPPQFCIIHGDLCFSNVLVANDLGFLRVVDPRGSFGKYDIYGDPRYELAKLMHSLDGRYDLIIEDMFTVRVENSSISLDVPKNVDSIYTVFRDEFGDMLSVWKEIKLIESLLFLSMLPLHSDKLSRQYAMLATGIRLLDETIGGDFYG